MADSQEGSLSAKCSRSRWSGRRCSRLLNVSIQKQRKIASRVGHLTLEASLDSRRDVVLGLLGLVGSSAAWPQAQRVRLVGVLNRQVVTDADVRFFSGALRDLGWSLGSVTFVIRGAGQSLDRFPELARELVGRGVDLIMVPGGVSANLAAKQATTTIPILAIGVVDPVKYGLATSLAHPGGNVTGLTIAAVNAGKWIQLARELIPGATRIAAMADPANVSYAEYVHQFEVAAREAGIDLQLLPISSN